MTFTYPIRNDRGRIVGVWSNRFNWEVAEQVLGAERERARARGERTTKLYVLDRDGTVLGSDRPEDVLEKRVANDPLFKRAARPKASGFAEAEALGGGGEVLAGWFHSAGFSLYPGLDWSVVATQDRGEALAAAGTLARDSLLIALVAAGAQETQSAIGGLSELARELEELAGHVKLADGAGRPTGSG